jgi:hypothetical protein
MREMRIELIDVITKATVAMGIDQGALNDRGSSRLQRPHAVNACSVSLKAIIWTRHVDIDDTHDIDLSVACRTAMRRSPTGGARQGDAAPTGGVQTELPRKPGTADWLDDLSRLITLRRYRFEIRTAAGPSSAAQW